MESVIIDTCILVDFLRGRPQAVETLKNRMLEQRKPWTSVITRIELMAGMRSGEEKAISRLLGVFEEVEVAVKIAAVAGHYMNKYAKSHGINTADAIIAASAKQLNASLYTLNEKHFPMQDVRVIVPY